MKQTLFCSGGKFICVSVVIFFSDPVVSFIYSICCPSPMDLVIYLYSIYYVLKFELGCTCRVISSYSSCLLCVDVVFDAVWYF